MQIINVALVILVLKLAAAAPCVTTTGEIGDCVPVSQCPEIANLTSVNVKSSSRNGSNLTRYKCGQSDESILVCCSRKPDVLIFENRNNSSTKLQNEKICGERPEVDEDLRKYIESIPNFPWLVGILTNVVDTPIGFPYKYKVTTKVRCTGTLLSSRYVLTSAQCLTSPVDDPDVFVRTEQFHLENWKNCPGYTYRPRDKTDTRKCAQFKDYSVEERIIHKDYDPATHSNDIALLRLHTLIPFEDYIRPVCLPIAETEQTQVGDVLYTSGWAKTDDIESDPYKRWSVYKNSSTTVLPNKNCQQCIAGSDSGNKYGLCSTKPEDAAEITCDDVMGNPVMFEYNNRWYIEGVTHSCSDCGEAMVHTKIADYLSWIEKNIRSEQCTTPNGYAGEYMYISNCPVLLHAFANPLNSTEEYLYSFLYESKAGWWQFLLPLVCCGTSSNFTVYEEPLSATVAKNISSNVDISKFCGWQNRDGYYSTNEDITTDEFPWAAAIYYIYYNSNPETGVYLSTGSIINNRYVLTTAHSGLDLRHRLVVRLGEYEFRNDKDCSHIPELDLEDCSNVTDYDVEEVINHPFSEFIPNIFNIVLLRLNKTIKFSDYVRPICLPSSNADVIKEGDVLYMTGWGTPYWQLVNGSQIKKKISTEVLSNKKCRQINLLNRPKDDYISALEFCTQDFENETTTVCDTDGGTPVMFYQKPQWYVAGISFTIDCEDRDPHIHTKVSMYLPWIYSNIKP